MRLPLQSLTVVTGGTAGLAQFEAILREELNVKTVELVEATDGIGAQYGITQRLVVNARAAGPRLGKQVQQAIMGAKNGDWSEVGGVVTAGGLELVAGEYELALVAGGVAEGTAISLLPGGGFVLLDTVTTPELEAEGVARDAIRVVQEARKNAGLEVSDRIVLALNVAPSIAEALTAHGELIAAETLAVGFAVQATPEIDAIVDVATSPGDGVFVSGTRALGADKAPIVVTIEKSPEGESA